ncbi:putative Fe-S cluster assembly protein SufT [Verrucomicrobiales bacterium]|jgi:probable FeS assembly SUF system protein SufT|nr:putative Fe-S cluster assembly protein SufT [Verrucomicrobiales bacterium]MDB4720553.1 putative Fe-S cluster assembly protein SufT [Verrucomicrobiales bacterium]|tara:strand:+ start:2708 stop:3283 length:576 start_codon:yes stop_codon:yes gene_type:complete
MNETNPNGGELELSREVEAIQIPSGDTFKLPAGTKVILTQSLGGTYTVATDQGLARISEEYSDALGLEEQQTEQPATEKVNSDINVSDGDYKDAVWEQLRTVFDPEIPVNIVDLGLIYDCNVIEENDIKQASVKMTLTAPGCGMGPTIAADAENKINNINGIDEAKVELVWDPPWTQEMISEEGKMKLGMI